MEHNVLYKIANSYFAGELLAPREGEEAPDAPQNMLENLLDELDEAIGELAGAPALKGVAEAVAYGFLDGALAVSSDVYDVREDEYTADSRNPAYADADRLADEYAAVFDGGRDWSEAAKGQARFACSQGGFEPGVLTSPGGKLRLKAFFHGADAAWEYDWKFLSDENGNVLVTDDDALAEYSAAKIAGAFGGRGLLGAITDMLGLSPSDLDDIFADDGEGEEAEGHGDEEPEEA